MWPFHTKLCRGRCACFCRFEPQRYIFGSWNVSNSTCCQNTLKNTIVEVPRASCVNFYSDDIDWQTEKHLHFIYRYRYFQMCLHILSDFSTSISSSPDSVMGQNISWVYATGMNLFYISYCKMSLGDHIFRFQVNLRWTIAIYFCPWSCVVCKQSCFQKCFCILQFDTEDGTFYLYCSIVWLHMSLFVWTIQFTFRIKQFVWTGQFDSLDVIICLYCLFWYFRWNNLFKDVYSKINAQKLF